MPVFMPGASRIGAVQAIAAAVSMSSARPLASRAMTFMEAGTMANRSQFRASQMWAISPGNGSSNTSMGQGWWVRARKVAGWTNRAASAVITGKTSTPDLTSWLARSAAL